MLAAHWLASIMLNLKRKHRAEEGSKLLTTVYSKYRVARQTLAFVDSVFCVLPCCLGALSIWQICSSPGWIWQTVVEVVKSKSTKARVWPNAPPCSERIKNKVHSLTSWSAAGTGSAWWATPIGCPHLSEEWSSKSPEACGYFGTTWLSGNTGWLPGSWAWVAF